MDGIRGMMREMRLTEENWRERGGGREREREGGIEKGRERERERDLVSEDNWANLNGSREM